MIKTLFERAHGILRKYETPVLVCRREKILQKFNLLKKLFPQVKHFYAMKANLHPKIVKIVADAGMGLDVSSPGELALAKENSVPGEEVIYTQPIKKSEEIKLARDYNVKAIIFDNEVELKKIAEIWKGAPVLLRIKVENPFCVVNLSEKFGAEPSEAKELIIRAKRSGLNPLGIAFHVGSQTTNPVPYLETLKITKRIFDILNSEGINPTLLDIGGGFPVVYKQPLMAIEQFVEPISSMLDIYFPSIEIISEPGRFIVGDACYLITRVVGKTMRKGMPWYYIDDGLYGSFSGKVYDHADYPVFTLKEGEKKPSIIAGPTCDSFDVVYREILLPELEVGDILIFTSMGAYTYSSASNFNGLEKPKIIIEEEEIEL